jgi:hypothetical protein
MVHSVPKEFTVPSYKREMGEDYKSALEKYRVAETKFIEDLKAWVKKNSKDKTYGGEVIRIAHADSHALYMVFSTKPVKLIHMPLGDAWDSLLAHRLHTKDVIALINIERIFEK